MMNALETLKAAYLVVLNAMIATYPRQEGNRAHYMARFALAELGTVVRPIRTKLGRNLRPGATVLVLPYEPEYRIEHETPCVYVWADDGHGETMTIVDADRVKLACPTCGGAGVVRHRAGLVAFSCPTCRGDGAIGLPVEWTENWPTAA